MTITIYEQTDIPIDHQSSTFIARSFRQCQQAPEQPEHRDHRKTQNTSLKASTSSAIK